MSLDLNSKFLFLLTALTVAPFSACNFGPAAIKQPSIDPSSAGKLAMEMYDKNGDGVVSGDELNHAPALKAALGNLDKNGDKGVSADEVAARVEAWKVMKAGLTSVRCKVVMDGEPLGGATVTFDPEPFLGDQVKPATGVTGMTGETMPTIKPEDRHSPKDPGGVQFGLYKVRISKMVNGKESIPARYNTDTTLGQEVAYDDPSIANRNMQFTLKSGN
jgi:hypothetical protein